MHHPTDRHSKLAFKILHHPACYITHLIVTILLMLLVLAENYPTPRDGGQISDLAQRAIFLVNYNKYCTIHLEVLAIIKLGGLVPNMYNNILIWWCVTVLPDHTCLRERYFYSCDIRLPNHQFNSSSNLILVIVYCIIIVQVSTLLELLFLIFISVHAILKFIWYGPKKFIKSKRSLLIVSQ